MTKSPLQVLETFGTARSVMEQLHARIADERNVLDVGDLVYIQTTVKQIENLFESAAQYEELLSRHLTRTHDRMGQPSP